MNRLFLFLLLFSFFANANFVNTQKPFDLALVGENCFLKLINKKGDEKRVKTVSMVLNEEGIAIGIDGYFLPNLKVPSSTKTIDIKKDGEISIYESEGPKAKEKILTRITFFQKDGAPLERHDCELKQGYIYKK